MQLLVLFMMLSSINAENILYVKPDDSLPKNCPSIPCLSLEQYINESSKYFTKSDTEFLFLPGNHSLQTPLNITEVSNISLKGINDDAVVVCTEAVTVVNVQSMGIKQLTFKLNFSSNIGPAFDFTNSQSITFTNCSFQNENSHSTFGTAVHSMESSIKVANCLFEGMKGGDGGAIKVEQGTLLTLTGNTFTSNHASNYGGAIYVAASTIILNGSVINYFTNNSGVVSGGAVYCYNTTVVLTGQNLFRYNFLTGNASLVVGGAIGINNGSLTVTGSANFSSNIAVSGGGIALSQTNALFKTNAVFKENIAKVKGGGIYVEKSTFNLGAGNTLSFIGNRAESSDLLPQKACGVMCIYNTRQDNATNNMSAILVNNSGTYGGAFFTEKMLSGFTFSTINARGNTDGAFGVLFSRAVVESCDFVNNSCEITGNGVVNINNCTVDFQGFEAQALSHMLMQQQNRNHTFSHNYADQGAISMVNYSTVSFHWQTRITNNVGVQGGGGITSLQSAMLFMENTVICHNSGSSGGGIRTIESSLTFEGDTSFCNNSALIDGGAMSVDRGKIYIIGLEMDFSNNRAASFGGALYIAGANFEMSEKFTFTSNTAQNGGAMYLSEGAILTFGPFATLITSNNTASAYGGAIYHKDSVTDLQCQNMTEVYNTEGQRLTLPESFLQVQELGKCPTFFSHYNLAVNRGNFLYGGLLDRSRLLNAQGVPLHYFTTTCNISMPTDDFTSQPYRLKFCDGINHNVTVYRGQTFLLNMYAVDQADNPIPAIVKGIISSTSKLKLNQSSQYVPGECFNLTFNLFSTAKHDNLILYPDGPCQSIGQASTVINVTFRDCPDAFQQFHEECVCDKRLKQYNANCTIDSEVSIVRHAGLNFWMNASYYENGTYAGLILYSSCPMEYCRKDTVNIHLDDPDNQCASNRSGILCGKCATGYSLLLGGSRCEICSNIYLLLLLVFALAGFLLIFVLSALKLTVATGAMNSLILYANFVQINRKVFFLSDKSNPLTVFIAWMNLDFGFELCFFDGNDAYIQTWLQYAFSVYVWIMICLIIVTSRYSVTISKVVGSNPIAVLATLLLMSYNKIMKIIIDVISSVDLDYPEGEHGVTVWLKDGNIPYLHSKHLFLSIFTIAVLVFIFLPYTIFLLLGHSLFRLPYKKYYFWLIIRILPLLDSYYAPYKIKTRYWTGFLLLLRCVLYSVFSFNSLGGMKYSLLAIIVSFSGVGSLTWLHNGIYRHFYMDVIEVSVYLNLIVLAATAAALGDAEAVTVISYTLVGIVFATFIGIIVFQIYLLYIAKSAFLLKIKSKLVHKEQQEPTTQTERDPLINHTREPVITKTVVDLRESLLET